MGGITVIMQVYTIVEDRPVEKERRTLLRETHRIEKQYVIETRFLSEREVPGALKACFFLEHRAALRTMQQGRCASGIAPVSLDGTLPWWRRRLEFQACTAGQPALGLHVAKGPAVA